MITANSFNPFWDASVMMTQIYNPKMFDLSIPFGMLPGEVMDRIRSLVLYFQSLLGCFLNIFIVERQSTFYLSIPFGMLLINLSSKNGRKTTFNPFWDASLRALCLILTSIALKSFQSLLGCFLYNLLLPSSFVNLSFNPFWDASMLAGEKTYIIATFNPFWDAS